MLKRKEAAAMSLAELMNDSSIDRVLAINMDWKILAWNKTSERVTGIPRQDVVGKHLLEVFPEMVQDEESLKAIDAAMQGKKIFLQSEPTMFNRHYYEHHYIPLKDESGMGIGVMNIMHDVSHRIKAERQLQKLNAALKLNYSQLEKANKELATFTAVTGTELKTPIRNIYTALEFIIKNEGQNLSHTSRASLRRIQSSINRMNLMLDDILALSTAGSFNQEFTRVNLNEVFADALVALRGKLDERNAVVDSDTLPTITGSRQMLQYLFVNLIDNAIKFQPPGNTPKVKISTSTAVNLCLSFTDNGIGFPQEDAERIFTMFERLNDRKQFAGSGIGLTMCRKIAETHGGHIEAEGKPGKGATFRCYLSQEL